MSRFMKWVILVFFIIVQLTGVLFFDVDHIIHLISVQLFYIIMILAIIWFKEQAFYFICGTILVHVIYSTIIENGIAIEPVTTAIVELLIAYTFYYIYNRNQIDREQLESIVHATKTGTWIWNMSTNKIIVNDEWANMVGYELEELSPTTLGTWIHLAHPEDLKRSNQVIQDTIDGKIDFYEVEIRMKHKDGHYIWILDRGNIIKRDAFGKAMVMVGTHQDITDQKMKHEKIAYISNHDYLTGLHNRRHFADLLEKHNQETYYPLGLFVIDFNGLKILNDAFGHDVGDVALKKVAKLLEESLPSRCQIARIGGDEFTIIVPKTSENEMETYKETLLQAIKKQKVQNVQLSLAIGYDIQFNDDRPIGEVLINAENKMYKNKLIDGKAARNKSIKAIFKTLTSKIEIEKLHAERVAKIATMIGEAMNLKQGELEELELSALYHDIGKITLPDEIILKPDGLTKEERTLINEHTENGYHILRAADSFSHIAKNALYHHEWYNGKGYPEGLKGTDIPLFSRIIALADTFDAITSYRTYHQIQSVDYAIKEIENALGTQFDPKIAKIFISKVIPNIK